jgi:hypothetical protein
MEITHSTLEENVLQEFTKDYLEKHKELIEFVKKETIKQLTLTDVSHQRELLIAELTTKIHGNIYFTKEVATKAVDDYLSNL